MRTPINDIDYHRFLELAELIYRNRNASARFPPEMRIWISGDFVSLEMKSHNITPQSVARAFSRPSLRLLLHAAWRSLVERLQRVWTDTTGGHFDAD